MSNITKKRILIGSVLLSLFVTVLTAGSTLNPELRDGLVQTSKSNPALMPSILVIMNTLSSFVLPISFGVANILLIPYVGWFEVFVFSLIGNLIGYYIGFVIARNYQGQMLQMFVSLEKVHEWEEKISSNVKFTGVFLLRMSTQGISDYISYILGLSKVSRNTFIIATLLSETIAKFIRYYLAHLGYDIHPLYFFTLGLPIFISYFLYYLYIRNNKLSDPGT